MGDNVKRGIRTAIQAALGLLAAGALSKIIDSYVTGNPLDPTLYLALTLIATAIAGWAQNMIEDSTGFALLAPKDREIGDQVLKEGLGMKLAHRKAGGTQTGRDYP